MLLMRDINASGMCEWCNPAMGILVQYISVFKNTSYRIFFLYIFFYFTKVKKFKNAYEP